MNFLLITGFYVLLAVLGVGIFLWGKPDGDSLFDRLYQVICVMGPRLLKKFLGKAFGQRAPDALDWLWRYLVFSSNPLVQMFYLLVVVGGFIVFVVNGFQHIPSRLISSWHRYTGLGVFLSCITCWWRACSTDPGTVTRFNVDELCKIFEWDEQIFSSQLCKTCNTRKPARSKHCSLCGICVARFDHHCIWVNNCIGIGNHKWFLGFLFSHQVLCVYGVYIGMMIIYQQVEDRQLLRAVFLDPVTRERQEATYSLILQYMLALEGMLIFVCIVAGVMGVVLAGFFVWHLDLVRSGTTTNEISKWGYLRYVLRHEEDGNEKVERLHNGYNKGWFANFREVFFNLDVHNLPSRSLPMTSDEKVKKN